MKLALNCIVKNESARILRMLESVAPYIVGLIVLDTGSTDNTIELIGKFCQEKKLPGVIGKTEFKDFAQARNAALAVARQVPFEFDYILLVDADMELKVLDPTWLDDVKGESYDMYQVAGTLKYQNRRLASKKSTGQYMCVTHEYLNLPTGGCIPQEKAFFIDHADGANRPEKFKRDIKLLKAAMEADNKAKQKPNERYMYYLAQSYRDAGKPDKAAKWYKRRVEAGGWDEEVWSAQRCYADCLGQMGDEAGFIRELLIAFNMRPQRAETLHELAKFYRVKGQDALSVLFSEPGMDIPPTGDALFVDDYVYQCGCKDEFAIAAYYVSAKRAKGFDVCNELTLKKSPYGFSRELNRTNIFHYYPMLKEVCPSFDWKKINFTPEENWIPLNPSVIYDAGRRTFTAIVRTVNYRIDEFGRYLIRGLADGSVNNTNPINTRNFLVDVLLDGTLPVPPRELKATDVMPEAPAYPLVIGLEDMRLFNVGKTLHASATVRQLRQDGLPEQVCVQIMPNGRLDNMKRLTHAPLACEKNWMPIIDGSSKPRWMYRLDERTNGEGWDRKVDCPWDIGALGGGTQVIPFHQGYLAIVHEARQIPGAPGRYYSHRFVSWDDDFKVTAISKPFGFHEKTIEYAMGLCWHPDGRRLVISYGFKDCEARLATVDPDEVIAWLHHEAA
jgi:glycosyltransferase involved in cell wall biosynthesis